MAQKVENKKYSKYFKVLSKSWESLECFKCNKSLHLKCIRSDKRRLLKYIQGNLEFLCQFCTDYTCHHCNKHVYMGKKLSYVMAVKSGVIKNVLDLQYINILGSQQIVMKLGTVGPANHKCLLSSV